MTHVGSENVLSSIIYLFYPNSGFFILIIISFWTVHCILSLFFFWSLITLALRFVLLLEEWEKVGVHAMICDMSIVCTKRMFVFVFQMCSAICPFSVSLVSLLMCQGSCSFIIINIFLKSHQYDFAAASG